MADDAKAKGLTVGYSRCSTKAQDIEDKAFGRIVQQRAISAWAEMSETTVDVWIHDNCSGATLDREGLAEIREIASRGQLARLVFARQDRLARDAHLADTVYKEIESCGGELVNVQMRFEKSMVGTILRRILDNFAELDRHQIAERTNKGRVEGVRKNGTHLYGFQVLGYRQLLRDECARLGLPHGTLVIDEREAKIVRTIFALRERGHSYYSIAKWLNEKGHASKAGRRFEQITVSKIVENEDFYRGERVGVSAEVLGMTDEEYAALKPAHPPILPPRESGQLLLVESMPSYLLKGARVPDDPLSDEPLRREKACHIHSLTKDYAAAVLVVRDMRAAGTSWAKVVAEINARGHRTRTGCTFGTTAAIRISERMGELEPLALEALARPLPDAPTLKADDWEGPMRMAHQMARRGLGRKKGEMSLGKIATALNAEFGHTPNGGKFHSTTVARLLNESPPPTDHLRTVAYARFTTDGVDHHGQMDAIGEWAALNGLQIAEWYVDKAPAYSKADNLELKRLLADGQDGRFQRVAVLALERFCRDKAVADDVARRLSASAELFLIGDSGSYEKKRPKRKRPPFVPARA